MLPSWVELALLSGAIYYPAKALTWRAARRGGLRPGAARTFAYLLLWPGMDARRFLDARVRAAAPTRSEWAWSGATTAFWAVALWAGVRRLPTDDPRVVGAAGFGCLFALLLFGVFGVLSALWRSLGIDAAPICRRPWRAASLAEFWGRRWNVAFRDLAHPWVFVPSRRALGPAGAAVAAFLASGLLHDVVLSVPARGGYGLPTLYFLIQVAGAGIQRAAPRGAPGVVGRVSTILVVAAPSPLLFHAPFLERVAHPLVRALGAA
jgi:alginate O-acetyltransferase complex protein AlgI